MLKRLLSLLAVLALLLNCAVAETAAVEAETHALEMKTVPFYAGAPENMNPDGFPLYFADGVDDMPYVELDTWAALLNELFEDHDHPPPLEEFVGHTPLQVVSGGILGIIMAFIIPMTI